MKKLPILLVTILLSGIFVSAQTNHSKNTKLNPTEHPIWIDMMQDGDANFYETVDAFNTYWESRPNRKSSGYNPFKRWEWYMSHKINPDGSRLANGHDRDQYLNFMENQRSVSTFSGDWTNIGPIHLPSSPNDFWGNGRINAIAFHPSNPDIFYIGAPAGGLWKTIDDGQTWFSLTDNQPTLGVSSIVVDYINPDVIYIGTGDRDAGDAAGHGVYKSIDGGVTFSESNTNMGSATVGRIIQSPDDSDLLLAATSYGIYKSTDAAATWSRTQTGNFKEIIFKPESSNVVYASASGKFYKSTDTGDSWINITNGIPNASRGVIDVSAANPNYVYFFTTTSSEYKGTYLSVDNGETFILQSNTPNVMGWNCSGGSGGQAWYDLDIAVDQYNENVIYAGGINCWKSSDAGQTWTMVSNQVGDCGADAVHADLHVLEWNPLNDKLYVGNDGGIWWTDNDGGIWNRITDGLAIGQQYKLGQSKLLQNHITTGYQDNGISLFHTDTWIQSDMYADGMECEMDNYDTTLSYGCKQYGNMYRSVNDKAQMVIAGNGINGVTESGNWITPFCQHNTNYNVMFIGYQNLWRTINLHQTTPSWTKISQNVGSGALSVVEHSPVDGNTFYYATSGNSFIRSDNIMDIVPDYANLTSNLPGSGIISDIEAHPWDVNKVYLTRSNQVFKSSDKGLSWENISGDLPNVNINDIAFYERSNIEGLYIATNIGIFFKDEFMDDWIIFSEGLPAAILATEVEIYHDADDITKDRIRSSSYGRGLWGSSMYYYFPTSNFTVSETNIPTDCPVNFTDLSQGYPDIWLWTFEGGTPSSSIEANPSGIVYESEGVYAVTLLVSNPDGSDTKTINSYITVVEGMLPIVDFNADKTLVCSNETIYLYDESEGCPTDWLWSFDPDNVIYLEGTTETSRNPVISLSEAGSYSVTLQVSNSSGQTELIKENYLTVGGQALPFIEDFSGNGFSEMGWTVENPDYNKTWDLTEVETTSGLKQVSWINIYNYTAANVRDYLISPGMSFYGYENVYMSFEYAYAQRFSPSDSLIVSLSDDCGESWTRVYANGPNGEGVFSTSEPTTEFFEPQDADDWCGAGYGADCPEIDLSSWAGNDNIKIRFESFARFSNNLYLTNIEINSTVGLIDKKTDNDNYISIQPNPANGMVKILVKNSSDFQMQLVDVNGHILILQKMNSQLTEVDISKLEKGIYFIRIQSEDFIGTKKLIVN